MAEVRRTPWNGLTVASLFAGSGGSSTGYRMAGFRVAYACEVVKRAADSYEANAAPWTTVDRRDVREVRGAEIIAALERALARIRTIDGGEAAHPGELDVLDGSPPCEPFSTAGPMGASGKRAKFFGKEREETGRPADDLFPEYARILREVRPRAFVAENVRGLTIGAARGYYREIHRDLSSCGYRVQARLLDAQLLGVPQVRRRVIFMGVREDLGLEPAFPRPHRERVVLEDAVDVDAPGELLEVRKAVRMGPDPVEDMAPWFGHDVAAREKWENIGQGGHHRLNFSLYRAHRGRPAPTVTATATGLTHPLAPRRFTIREGKAICSFPPDFELVGSYADRWERLGDAVPPLMMREVARAIAGLLSSAA